VDVQAILSAATESARDTASERQIVIVCDGLVDQGGVDQGGAVLALGDGWATRRIFDNLIANAIRFAPPGGTVSVAVARNADSVIASVSDTGCGLPPHLTRLLGNGAAEVDDGEMPATGGTGLTLSNRLARAMNGRLTVTRQPGAGATVSLSLPAA
jgi:two-component system sensor histidine kinase BaeS